MKQILLVLVAIASVTDAVGQIPDISVVNATTAANFLTGTNVTVSNATFQGHSGQLSTFADGMDKIGFAEGVAITTGFASFAGSFGTGNVGDAIPTGTSHGDADLELLIGTGNNVDNAGVLEFDFVTTGTSVSFEFVFASEEYLEWVGSGYNDAFGFFLSGPGISGSFSGGAVNLATIGGSPISVNTVNTSSNSTYYIDNEFNNPLGNPLNEGNAQFAYDGLTVVMTVSHQVQCNQQYHIKLAICNTNDELFDSGVFIKKGTLASPHGAPGPLTILPPLLCAGEDLTLTVGGDPDWTYTWSTGQSGVGLQQITTQASLGVNAYSVSATYLPGCSLSVASLPSSLTVHDPNNQPPICLGVNATGAYEAYVQAGDQLCFTIPTSDYLNEGVEIQWDAGSPGAFSDNGAFQETGLFCWTPSYSDLGYHSFEVTATDLNVCGSLSSTCLFTIKVVCHFCPISVFYENRSPDGLPLPQFTTAAWRIVAGESVDPIQTDGPVSTGDAVVEFRAPEIILDAGFTAGPGFLAIPDPNSCLDECDACCDDWNGFTVDAYDPDGDGVYELNNWFEPDGDGWNDYWQVHDADHPFCAYGAQGYELTIWVGASGWGNPVWYGYHAPGECCPFESRAPENQIPHSSIYWDGTINTGFWSCLGCPVTTGATYFYVLNLYGCEGEVTYTGYIYVAGSSGYNSASQGSDTTSASISGQFGTPGTIAIEDLPEMVLNDAMILMPNPTSDLLTLTASFPVHQIEVLDMLGRRQLSQDIGGMDHAMISVVLLSPGEYILWVKAIDGQVHHRKFIRS